MTTKASRLRDTILWKLFRIPGARLSKVPHGAPTSPFLCNIVLRDFDRRLGKWCRKRGITCTRYSDDLIFSGSFDPIQVEQEATRLLREYGFFPNPRKTVVVSGGQRQQVTGLVVNEKVSVPKEKKRKIRQEMYSIWKYGLPAHLEQIHEKDPEHYLRGLAGRIACVLSVDDSEEFQEYKAHVSRLMKTFHEKAEEDTGVCESIGYEC